MVLYHYYVSHQLQQNGVALIRAVFVNISALVQIFLLSLSLLRGKHIRYDLYV